MKSLHKVLDLIETVAETGSIGIRDIAARTGFPPATVHRMAAVLSDRGYLLQHPDTRHYSLSNRFLELGDQVQRRFELVPVARPHLERLSADTGQNANLCVLDGRDVVYIDNVYSRKHMLQTFTRLGARVPLYATGVGKIFLSHMDGPGIDAYLGEVRLKRYTEMTITRRGELVAEIDHIRSKGYAIDNQEKEHGVRCIAAPVKDHNNCVIAAVSVSGASQWVTMERIESLAAVVMKHAEAISVELGYRPNK